MTAPSTKPIHAWPWPDVDRASHESIMAYQIYDDLYKPMSEELRLARAEIERLRKYIPTTSSENAEYMVHNWREAAHSAKEETAKFWNELQASQAKLAAACEVIKKAESVLKKHHDWHLQEKEVACENGFTYDLATEYCESDLYKSTTFVFEEIGKLK